MTSLNYIALIRLTLLEDEGMLTYLPGKEGRIGPPYLNLGLDLKKGNAIWFVLWSSLYFLSSHSNSESGQFALNGEVGWLRSEKVVHDSP